MLDGDLCTLRAVVNPVGTCLELANHLELKSAQKGGDKQAGGLVEWPSCGLLLVVNRLVGSRKLALCTKYGTVAHLNQVKNN